MNVELKYISEAHKEHLGHINIQQQMKFSQFSDFDTHMQNPATDFYKHRWPSITSVLEDELSFFPSQTVSYTSPKGGCRNCRWWTISFKLAIAVT